MPKPEKAVKVKELTERFRSSSGAMFADFRGLTVHDSTDLRRSLRSADASLAIAKNTLTRLAVREAGLEDAVPLLEGPTAIAFLQGDAVAGAKAVLDLTKRFPALVVKGALIEGRVLGADDASSLATLEAKEVSLAKLAGLLQAPLSRIAYLLQAPLQRMAYALAERARQGGLTESAPAEVEARPAAPEPEAAREAEPEAPAAEPEAPATEAEGPNDGADAEAEPQAEPAPDEPTTEAATDEPTAPTDES
jgi:large subunit ribosomal protein L10